MGTIPPPPPGRFDDDEPENDTEELDGPSRPVKIADRRWKRGLLKNAAGKVKNLEHNIAQVLRQHPAWQGVIAFDQFACKLMATKAPPCATPGESYPRPWRDVDTVRTMVWLQSEPSVLIDATRNSTDNSIDSVGQINAYHPVQSYLYGLKWDLTPRLATLLSRYFGAEQTDYLAAAGAAWMISAVARIMRPGCQADYMLVLEGNQGARKSSALRELFSDEWFTDARITLNDEGLKKLRGKWCVEIAELESFRGKASTEIKAFITSRIDQYRDSYGRRPQDYPRTCVMAGTTNEREYLVDRTGNRRFWPVLCGALDIEALRADRDQLWAEAVARFGSGERWWLEDESGAREEQRKRELREPWFEIIASWLERPTVPTDNGRRSLRLEEGFTIADVMTGALNLRATDMQQNALTRVGWCMHKLGYERRWKTTDGHKERRYFSARRPGQSGSPGTGGSGDPR